MEPMNREVALTDIGLVAEDLAWLSTPPMFFGGSIMPLYVDDPAMLDDEPRPTEDVDLLIVLPQGTTQAQLEAQLRELGWRNDMRAHRRNTLAYVTSAPLRRPGRPLRLYVVRGQPPKRA